MVIYLIRHAQTVHNKKGKVFSGKSDVSLSPEGIGQAEKCKGLPFLRETEEIYITPLVRTAQTADIIFPESIPRYVSPSLSEMDFGDYEGKILEEDNTDDEVFRKWLYEPEGLTFPGGDNFVSHAREALSAFTEIAEKSGKNTVSVISHATTIRLIITQLLGKELSYFRNVPCENCSVAKIIYENGKFTVEELNITA